MSNKDGRIRKNIEIGVSVQIVLKQDQKSGFLTKGTVEEILTAAAKHPHGIKVRLRSGKVGRVKKVLSINKFFEAPDPITTFLPPNAKRR